VVLSACAQVQTDPVANVTSTTATLKAHVTGDNKPMTYWFQYGKSTSYGIETTHRNGGSGSSPQAVAESVTGLTPGSTYH
ncbi:MAG TPA: hypothetical protein VGJ70_15090, partial [Solirubrobacteraceae bacterium]